MLLDRETLKEIKAEAEKRGISMQRMMAEVIKQWAENRKESRVKRVVDGEKAEWAELRKSLFGLLDTISKEG